MTFPLGSLRAEASPSSGSADTATYTRNPRKRKAQAPQPARWRTQLGIALGGVLWLLALLAMASHNAADPAWSTSGTPGVTRNWAGTVGAYFSDLLLWAFGFSAWWFLFVSARAWLGALARLLRDDAGAAPADPDRPRWLFWLGLVLLLAASCSLEYTRLYHWESRLPGLHAGGVLGYSIAPLSMKALGFAGSGVLWIAALLVGLSLTLKFSWLAVAERIGAWIEGWRELRQERIERAEDRRIGERALREREHVFEVERQIAIDQAPIVIEPHDQRDPGIEARHQGTPEAAVQRAQRHQAAAGRSARCGARPRSRRSRPSRWR